MMTAKPPRKKRASPEYRLHTAIVCFLRLVLPNGWIVNHCRNGGKSKGENGRAKAMGANAGWPDLELLGYDGFHGFLEVKTPKKGRLSPEQRKIHERLNEIGRPVAVVKSIDDVKAALRAWGIVTMGHNHA